MSKDSRTLEEWQKEIHRIAKDKGWHEMDRNEAEIISLIHSELSEALEEYREGNMDIYYEDGKPEGYVVELVDVLIRILDHLEERDVDTEKVLREKCDYNRDRNERHGGKRI